jgi:guanine nucleotide-binding protein subunit beta-2-like 1 protein
MWDLNECKSMRMFKGHTKDVLSVAFSPDNRQIISGGRDKTIRLWNTLGENKFTIESAHNDWVSSVRFTPNAKDNLIFSAGWDKKVKIWDKVKMSEYLPDPAAVFSTNYLNALGVAPTGAFVAAGGREGVLKIWGVKSAPEKPYYLEPAKASNFGSVINALAFSPKYFWVLAGTENGLQMFDFMNNSTLKRVKMYPLTKTQEGADEDKEVDEEEQKKKEEQETGIGVSSLILNPAGNIIYAGCTDNAIRVFEIKEVPSLKE